MVSVDRFVTSSMIPLQPNANYIFRVLWEHFGVAQISTTLDSMTSIYSESAGGLGDFNNLSPHCMSLGSRCSAIELHPRFPPFYWIFRL